jgi:phospholipid/cholesterol/gamma-HCH transport system substrate-binding protein
METRVRYIAVGLFAVIVGLAAIFLALWIQGGGGLHERRQVEIKFQGPALGLRAGTDVTFNGLHVGEVTGVAFDRNDPNVVDALVSVDAATPLSATTQVSLDTQGLMGSVYVSLHGGTADKPLMAPAGARLPVLVAPTMPSVTQAAQQTLGQIQSLIGDNSKPLHELIANLQTFSGVLADNSGRIDKILAGLEQMTGGGGKPPPPPTFNLATPAVGDLLANVPQVQLVIPDPTSAVSLDTQRFVSAKPDGELTLQTAQWSDTIPKVVQANIQRAFEKARYRYASLPADSLTPDYQLLLKVGKFQILEGDHPTAEIELDAQLVNHDGKVVGAQVVNGTAPAAALDGSPAAQAVTQAFAAAAKDLFAWYGKTLRQTPPH